MTREDVRSDEEYSFYLWLLEAVEHGLVEKWAYEPTTFVIHEDVLVNKIEYMKTKQKYIDDVPLFENAHHGALRYTPDFVFTLTPKGMKMFRDNVFWRQCQCQRAHESFIIHVDVKGSYNPHGGTKGFFLKQRFMWDRHMLYVSKVSPDYFFKRTWAPESYRWMKNRRKPTMTKLGRMTVSVGEYLKRNAWRLNTISDEDLLL